MASASVPRSPTDAASRLRGLFLGLTAGFEQAFDSRETVAAELELVAIVARTLTGPEVALEPMVDRWVALAADAAVRPDTRITLEWLRDARRPPSAGDLPPYGGALVRFLPLAALAGRSAANLVGGTYHLAALLDPDPLTMWSAVAVNVAAAQFLHGRKDFVADAIEALRANDAPEPALTALRRLPLEPVADLAALDPTVPVDCMHLALWLAQREPRAERALEQAGARGGWVVPLTGALLGARGGETVVRRAVPGGIAESALVDRVVEPLLTVRKGS